MVGRASGTLPSLDYKNLEYLQTAKRLNSRQARWAVFFSRFNFHLAYRPGTKNVKSNDLSRYFENPIKETNSDTILRPEVFVPAIEIDIERVVQQAQDSDAAPSNCPDRKLFVPACTRSESNSMGTFLSTLRSLWHQLDYLIHSAQVLVAGDERGHT